MRTLYALCAWFSLLLVLEVYNLGTASSPVCYLPVLSRFNKDEWHVETKQSKGQKISHEILSLLSPLLLFTRFHLFSLSPLFPLSLNGPNLSIISIKTKGAKEFIKKKKKKSHKTNPIFYLIIFHIELSRHQDQSLLAGENRCLRRPKRS